MATLPKATTRINEIATAAVGGTDLVALIGPVPDNADAVPRLFGSASAIYTQHGYSELVERAALHTAQTRKPMLVIGLPIATAGAISREDTSGNTGTSVTTVAAGGDGVLTEHEGELTVETGGTVGTDQIVLTLSLDGGRSTKRVRLGTATSYTIPYVGVTISFAAGTLVADDVIHTWFGSGPRSDSSGWSDAFDALAAQARQVRTIELMGDFQNDTEASAFLALVNAYETSYDRFVFARGSVLDRLPLATLSSTSHRMTGSPNVTFAEVGATGDTITRSAGSWATDGFATGDILTISGSTSNDMTTAATVTVTSPTVVTLDTDDLADEGPVGSVTIVGEASLTFSDADDEIVRSGGSPGSWLDDGFRVGDSITITGTAANNITTTVVAVTDTTLEVTAAALSDEVIGITAATITAGQTKAAWMAAITTEFAPIDDEPRLSLSAGRGRVFSPFTQWNFRRPAGWAAGLREYQHDLQITPWRKSDGNTGFDLYDADGQLVEWDDRVDGEAATAARFTSFQTWGNGPGGAFLAGSLTRALDSSLLVHTHNVAVVNHAQATCQTATEAVIGRSLVLNDDGTATTASLREVESAVNAALQNALLVDKEGEGPRASSAKWEAATDDVLNVADATLTGVLTLNLLGTIVTVNTTINIRSGGQ